jgi:excisionase family DNA binding protein
VEDEWLTVDEVAEMLGLHVKTVRGYAREGRLPAVRIGKSYRIARADLDAFVGRPAPPPRQAEVSAVVEIDGISRADADRFGTLVIAGLQMVRPGEGPLKAQTVYDESRRRLRVIVIGDPLRAGALLQTIGEVVRDA